MNREAMKARMRDYFERQRICLDDVERRLDAYAAGGLGWEEWAGFAGGDAARIAQLGEEYALLRGEWDDAAFAAETDLAEEARALGRRAEATGGRFFAVIEEAEAAMAGLREELSRAAQGKAALRRYRAPGAESAPHLDTQA